MIPTSRTPRTAPSPDARPAHTGTHSAHCRALFGSVAGARSASLLAALALFATGCARSGDGPRASAPANDPPAPIAPDRALPNFLTIDPTEPAHIRVEWTTAAGKRIRHEADRLFLSPTDHTPMGGNLSAFIALGGKRLDKGAGHPLGAIVRIGFYKVDKDAPFFDDIDPTSPVTITCSNIRFDRPVDIHHDSGIHHSMYDHMKVMAYGMSMKAMDTHNLVSATDTLNDRVVFGQDARPGALAPRSPHGGGISVNEQPDGSYTLVATLPYPLFRHIRDDGTLPEPIKDMDHETMIRMMEAEMKDMPRSDERGEGMGSMNMPGMNNSSTMHGGSGVSGMSGMSNTAEMSGMSNESTQPAQPMNDMNNMQGMDGMKDAAHADKPLGPDGLPMTDPAMPGGFFEPYHFHVEFQAVPKGAKPHTPERSVLPSEQ